MKTRILKPVLPLAAVLFAIAGAFAANVKPASSSMPPVVGYTSLPGQLPCSTEVPCQTETAAICRIQHTNGLWYDAFQKVGNSCNTNRLYMRQ